MRSPAAKWGRTDKTSQQKTKRGRRPSIIRGSNNYTWYTTARERSANRLNPIRTYLLGPLKEAKDVKTPLEAWQLLISDDIINKIVLHTNQEMERCRLVAEVDDS